MDKERKLAEKEGRLDPIHKCWEDTNDRWTGGAMAINHNDKNANYMKLNLALVSRGLV